MKKIILIISLFFSINLIAKELLHNAADFLYRVDLVRATPGKLESVISSAKSYQDEKSRLPYLMRHSQGDHWDLMIVWPVISYQKLHSDNNYSMLSRFYKDLGSDINFLESTYMQGPDNNLFEKWYKANKLFHIEMFVALPEKKDELLTERKMESQYLINIDRKPNLLFRKEQGANWDAMTIGFYGSLKEFATMGDIPLAVDDKAAIDAGFKGVGDIGYYLRSLLQRHNDTLAKKP